MKMFRDLKERISETAEMQKKLEKQLPHLDKVKLSAAEIFMSIKNKLTKLGRCYRTAELQTAEILKIARTARRVSQKC